MDSWLIVGLGNPGPSYAGNRHNIGAMVVDQLADRADASFRSHKARARIAEIRLGTLPGGAPGPRAVLARPLTYMNESGGPVAGLMQFFKITIEGLIVVHDDIDLPFASVRLKRGGGEGGHNGLRSISKSVGSKDYLRVRLGVDRPPARMDPATFVLKDFNPAERKALPFLLGDGVDAVDDLVALGLEAAQQRFHTR